MVKESKASRLMGELLGDVRRRSHGEREEEEAKRSVLDDRKARAMPAERADEKPLEMRAFRRIDPEKCRMWPGHNRRYDLLDEEACQDLVEGFKAQGQQIPAIVREVSGVEGVAYEVIAGARRHWTAMFLGEKLLVEVRQLGDREAFLLADAENRQRKDISDYERALDYRRALDHHFKSQAQMASAMEVGEGYLSQHLALADLPEEVVSAYRSITEVRVKHARALRPFLDSKDSRERILNKARALTSEGGVPGPRVIKELLAAAKKPGRGGYLVDESYSLPSGDHLFRITKAARGGFKIEFAKSVDGSAEEIGDVLMSAIRKHFEG